MVQGQYVNMGLSEYEIQEGGGGLDRANMESIRVFLVYVDRTYRDINSYLKGFYLTLYIWRPCRYDKRW